MFGMDTSARCTCPRGVPHACGEIRPQRRSQRAKRTGILMTDASHRVFEPAPQQYLCPRPLRVYLNSSKVARTPQNRFGTTCGTTNKQAEFSKFGSETVHKRARHGDSIWPSVPLFLCGTKFKLKLTVLKNSPCGMFEAGWGKARVYH